MASFCALAVVFVVILPQAVAQSDLPTAYAKAESLVRDHNWDDGVKALEPLLRAHPGNARLLNLMGLAYTGKRAPEKADQYFEAALKLHPGFVPVLKNLAINEAAMGEIGAARKHLLLAAKEAPDDHVVNLYLGEFAYRRQDFQHAAQYLSRAGDFVSHDPNLLASLGIAKMKTGDHESAMKTLAEIDPDALKPELQVNAGVALAEAGSSERAIPYLEAARASTPMSTSLAYDLALCYIAVKRFPDAIDLLTGLSAQGQETAETDALLAESYEANHQTQSAVDSLRKAIALNPEDENNYLAFASLCMDHQALDDANKVLAVGLTVHPRSARLLFERGVLNAMQDHYDLAEKDFQASADLAPADNSAYIGLGVTLLETGNAARAVPLLRKRLKDKPGDANLSYLLAEALLKTDTHDDGQRSSEARTLLEAATRREPTLVEPHISLGTIYLRDGRLQDAAAQLEQARTLDPTAKSAYSHLAIVYRKLGEETKSRKVLDQLRSILDRERNGSRQPVSPGDASSKVHLNARTHTSP